MSSKFRLNITVNDPAPTVKNQLNTSSSPVQATNALESYINKMVSGVVASKILLSTTAVSASGTITLSSFVANDTVTINGTVLTGKASPSGAVQFLIGGTDTITAAALAACINANTTLQKTVSATSALAVVTVSCSTPGVIGNLCTLAISAHGTVSGAVMTGGTEDNLTTISHGI